ncbi:UNVERIFIED_CONTAM: hypothetical protein HHA_218500 [Hammondia hammondi]|eukprot:XP_008889343.1 hypothetical protein HHA_218500 [Hammondia hammondi]
MVTEQTGLFSGPDFDASGDDERSETEDIWRPAPSRCSRSESPTDSPVCSQNPPPERCPTSPVSSPSLRLFSCTSAFATHTPHTVLLISWSSSSHCGASSPTPVSAFSPTHSFAASAECAFPASSPSPATRGLHEQNPGVSSSSPALLLTCCGASVIVSPVQTEGGSPCVSARADAGQGGSEAERRFRRFERVYPDRFGGPSSSAASPQFAASVSPARASFSSPPRVYRVHTALVTTLSFSASLSLVCSSQRPAPHSAHFASLWCPYTVQERARLPLLFAARADVVSSAFLPDHTHGLLLLVRDGKHSIIGYMNLRTKLAQNASTYTPRSLARASRLSPPSSALQSRLLLGTSERFDVSPGVPRFAPDFVVDCGRQPVLGLAVEPTICAANASRFLATSTPIRFASFGQGHLRLWSVVPKTKQRESEAKVRVPGARGGAASRRNRKMEEKEFPPPSFRSCCFGPAFLSREAGPARASHGVCTPGCQSLRSVGGPATDSRASSRVVSAQKRSSLQAPSGTSFPSFLFPDFPSSSPRNPSQVPLVTAAAFLAESRELLAGTADGFVFVFRGLTAIRALSVSSPASPSAVCLLLPFRKSLLLAATKNGLLTLLRTTGQVSRRGVRSCREPASSKRSERLPHRGEGPLANRLRPLTRAKGKSTPRGGDGEVREQLHGRREPGECGRPSESLALSGESHEGRVDTLRGVERERIPLEAARTLSSRAASSRSLCSRVSGRNLLASDPSWRRLTSVGKRNRTPRRVSRAPFADRVLDRPVRTPRSSYSAAFSRPQGRSSAFRVFHPARERSLSAAVKCTNTGNPNLPGDGRQAEQRCASQRAQDHPSRVGSYPLSRSLPSPDDCPSPCFSFPHTRPSRRSPSDNDGLREDTSQPDSCEGRVSRVHCPWEGISGFACTDTASQTACSERSLHVRDILRFHAYRNFAGLTHHSHPPSARSQSFPPSALSPFSACPLSPANEPFSPSLLPSAWGSTFSPSCSPPHATPWFPSQFACLAGWSVSVVDTASRATSSEPSLVLVTDSHIFCLRLSPLLPSSSLLLAQQPWGSIEAATAVAASAAPPLSLCMEEESECKATCESAWSPRVRHTSGDRGWTREMARRDSGRQGRGGSGAIWGDDTRPEEEKRCDSDGETRQTGEGRGTRIRQLRAKREEIARAFGSILVTGGRCPVGGALHLWRVCEENANIEALGPPIFFEAGVTAVAFSSPLFVNPRGTSPLPLLSAFASSTAPLPTFPSPPCSLSCSPPPSVTASFLAVGCEDGSVWLFLLFSSSSLSPPSPAVSARLCLVAAPFQCPQKAASEVTALAFRQRVGLPPWLAVAYQSPGAVQCLELVEAACALGLFPLSSRPSEKLGEPDGPQQSCHAAFCSTSRTSRGVCTPERAETPLAGSKGVEADSGETLGWREAWNSAWRQGESDAWERSSDDTTNSALWSRRGKQSEAKELREREEKRDACQPQPSWSRQAFFCRFSQGEDGFPTNCELLFVRDIHEERPFWQPGAARRPLPARGSGVRTPRSCGDTRDGDSREWRTSHVEFSCDNSTVTFPLLLHGRLHLSPPSSAPVRVLRFTQETHKSFVVSDGYQSPRSSHSRPGDVVARRTTACSASCEPEESSQEELLCQTADGVLAAFSIPSGRRPGDEGLFRTALCTRFFPWASPLPLKAHGVGRAAPNPLGKVLLPGPLHQGVSPASARLVAFYTPAKHALACVALPALWRCLPLVNPVRVSSFSSVFPGGKEATQSTGQTGSGLRMRGKSGARPAGLAKLPFFPWARQEDRKEAIEREQSLAPSAHTCVQPVPDPPSFLRGAGLANLFQKPSSPSETRAWNGRRREEYTWGGGATHEENSRQTAYAVGFLSPPSTTSDDEKSLFLRRNYREESMLAASLQHALQSRVMASETILHDAAPTALLWVCSCSPSPPATRKSRLPVAAPAAQLPLCREFLVSVSGRDGFLLVWDISECVAETRNPSCRIVYARESQSPSLLCRDGPAVSCRGSHSLLLGEKGMQRPGQEMVSTRSFVRAPTHATGGMGDEVWFHRQPTRKQLRDTNGFAGERWERQTADRRAARTPRSNASEWRGPSDSTGNFGRVADGCSSPSEGICHRLELDCPVRLQPHGTSDLRTGGDLAREDVGQLSCLVTPRRNCENICRGGSLLPTKAHSGQGATELDDNECTRSSTPCRSMDGQMWQHGNHGTREYSRLNQYDGLCDEAEAAVNTLPTQARSAGHAVPEFVYRTVVNEDRFEAEVLLRGKIIF